MSALSPAQRHVLERMRDGWLLQAGGSAGGGTFYWLGRIRESGIERVRSIVFSRLYHDGLIEADPKNRPLAPVLRYVLTDAGRKAVTP